MNSIEHCKPYIFRAQGDSEGLPDGPAYCFEIVIDGKPSHYLATRNLDGEDLMKREYPGKGYDDLKQYMTIVSLTDEQIAHASSAFGKFVGGEFVQLTIPLGGI
jgi:hypothetical protein